MINDGGVIMEKEKDNDEVINSAENNIDNSRDKIIEENSKDENEDTKETENDEVTKLNDILLRTAAEFDNYKKRTQKELVQRYNSGVVDTVKKFVDTLENLERALEACKEDNEIKKGIEMTLNQFNGILSTLKVEAIDPKNELFDPNFHNAVMHIEDSEFEANTVCEVFQKGYKIGDSVIRFAMVKVAN